MVEIGSADAQVGLRANGQVILFDGFLKVYEEGRDDSQSDGDDKRLPQLMQGEAMQTNAVTPEQHFTQPPPRYTEATLVKRMEELGIGRPSTYASIVTTIQERDYVRKEQNRLIPEDKGRIVTIFLLNFFKQYVEYEFTAGLEDQLDNVSAGNANYKDLLGKFWRDFSAAIAETSELRITEVLDVLDDALAPQLYPPRADSSDPRSCPKCGVGVLHLKTSRTGGFVGCGNYPDCRFTRPMNGDADDAGDRVLGEDAGDEISLKKGRFGPYIQRGEATEEQPKPPRASLPKGWAADEMDLEKALLLLNLPREIGPHPEDGEMIEAGIGRYGPFVKHGRLYANLKEAEDVFTIGMNRAVEELAKKAASRGGARGSAGGRNQIGGRLGCKRNQQQPVLGLVDNPTIAFSDSSCTVAGNSGLSSIKYFYSNPEILSYPKKEITMPECEVKFVLNNDTLSQIKRASAALGHKEISLTPADGSIKVSVINPKDASSHSFSVLVEGDYPEGADFNLIFSVENLKMIGEDYEVFASSKMISNFKSLDSKLEYFIALEKASTSPGKIRDKRIDVISIVFCFSDVIVDGLSGNTVFKRR